MDIMLLHEVDKLVLHIVRVELYLVDHWLDTAVCQHVPKRLDVKVRNTNTFH